MNQSEKLLKDFTSLATLKIATNVISPNVICPVEMIQMFSPVDFYLSHSCFTKKINDMEKAMQRLYDDNTLPLYEVRRFVLINK